MSIIVLASLCAMSRSPVIMMAKGTGVARDVTLNRQARQNYELLEEYEAGISLVGTEVKSCRAGKINLRDGYCQIKDGECWLRNVHIARHQFSGTFFQHDETRSRRLLLNKREIRKLDAAVQQKGLTIVPVKAYFNCDNRLKLQIALARGKNVADKRDTIKQRDTDREVKRQMKDY